MMKTRILLLGLVTLCAAGGIYYLHREPPAEIATPIGTVRETEIRIAPEGIARLDSILVKPGQQIHKGDVLAGSFYLSANSPCGAQLGPSTITT